MSPRGGRSLRQQFSVYVPEGGRGGGVLYNNNFQCLKAPKAPPSPQPPSDLVAKKIRAGGGAGGWSKSVSIPVEGRSLTMTGCSTHSSHSKSSTCWKAFDVQSAFQPVSGHRQTPRLKPYSLGNLCILF